MAAKQMPTDGFSSNLAGMSKNQLYDIMSQMKILIEQNQQQARQILVENPSLTKALFQAQIMLGMVQPPQPMPAVQQAVSQAPQQSVQPVQPPSVRAPPVPQQSQVPVQIAPQDQSNTVQNQNPGRKQQPPLPVPPIPSASVPPVTHQSQTMPSHPLQSMQPAKGHMSAQGIPMSLPQTSQVHNMPSHHSTQQPPPFHQPQMPTISSQPQQSLHASGGQHHSVQPPLPSHPRPPSMQPFQHQPHPQMAPHMGYQTSGAPQPHLSQPPFSVGNRHPGNIGFPQGQPPLPTQPPPQSMYQVGGSHLGPDFNNQGGGSMQVDRSPWMPGPPENSMGGPQQLPGPPPLASGQMGQPPPRPPQLTPEMEKALLQQVMSLTPDQINLLPPEQRQQVIQLQQMMR